jgi:hypothetical protein
MALQGTRDHQAIAYQLLGRAVLIFGVILAVMLILTAVFGVHGVAPSFQLGPDPAGLSLPF